MWDIFFPFLFIKAAVLTSKLSRFRLFCFVFFPLDWLKTSATWALKCKIITIDLRRTVTKWNIRLNQAIDNNNLVTIQEIIIECASRDNGAIKKKNSKVNQRRCGSWLMPLYRRKLHFLLLMKSKEPPTSPSSHHPPPDNFAPPPWALTPHQQSRLYVFFLLASYLSPRPNDDRVFLPPSQLVTEKEKPPPTSPSRESRQLAGGTGAGQRQVRFLFFVFLGTQTKPLGGETEGRTGESVTAR